MPKVRTTQPSIFARRLIELRKSRQLTQEELAEALGLSKSTIAYYEAAAKNPRLETIQKLADFFDVSPAVFVTDNAHKARPGSASRLERQVERIKGLSPAKQRMISDMLEAALNAK